ncbi:hypothetical protein BJ170DRAFT_591053 [Xylariales sp. AK1849]|nr:hypothetical protein BJ170DRAFT_591053 [Xylariales sp. AK1849]
MGIDAGFDMVPRLSRATEDRLKWDQFIESVKLFYDCDEQVDIGTCVITFKAGEHPSLPVKGHKFLRFSSKVSGGIATETAVEDYIRMVTCMAKASFGARVQFWHESADQYGFYDWTSVYASIKSYEQGTPRPESPQFDGPASAQSGIPSDTDTGLYSVVEIAGRGKGLVAKVNISKGTRILCEKPLFTVARMSPRLLHEAVAEKLKSLSKNEQRQFLSLHNNFPGQYAFSGIVLTNALPCGSGSTVGGIYLKTCLINHNCIPNAHNNWNEEARHETIHAAKNILVGEEIMISYDANLPSIARWAKLKSSFGFQCRCELCTLPANELIISDRRRLQIEDLDSMIGDPRLMLSNPLKSLTACRDLLQILEKEYGDAATALLARLYYDAFQISAAHGDQARASVFAERAYTARVECEGEDSPLTRKVKGFMQDPTKHATFGACSKKWRSTKTAKPKKLDAAGFEKWLWRLSN